MCAFYYSFLSIFLCCFSVFPIENSHLNSSGMKIIIFYHTRCWENYWKINWEFASLDGVENTGDSSYLFIVLIVLRFPPLVGVLAYFFRWLSFLVSRLTFPNCVLANFSDFIYSKENFCFFRRIFSF